MAKRDKSAKLNRAIAESRGEETDVEVDAVDEARRVEAAKAVPEGFVRAAADVIGYWDPKGPAIYFEPVEARLIDSHLDPSKVSCLVVGRLLAPLSGGGYPHLVDGDGVISEGKEGDIVGVWAKPGMKGLGKLCGTPVYMYLDGTKDIGKPSPMAVFAVLFREPGTPIPVVADTRTKSRKAKDPLGLVEVG